MPSYQFKCGDCNQATDAYLEMFEDRPSTCPSCSGPLAQVFAGQAPQGIVYGNPKTFGQQAELNEKRLGKEQMQLLAEKSLSRKKYSGPVPEGARERKKSSGPHIDTGEILDMTKIKDPLKYIHTGEA